MKKGTYMHMHNCMYSTCVFKKNTVVGRKEGGKRKEEDIKTHTLQLPDFLLSRTAM